MLFLSFLTSCGFLRSSPRGFSPMYWNTMHFIYKTAIISNAILYYYYCHTIFSWNSYLQSCPFLPKDFQVYKEWNLHPIKQMILHKRLFPSFSSSPSFLLSTWGENSSYDTSQALLNPSFAEKVPLLSCEAREGLVTCLAITYLGLMLKGPWKKSSVNKSSPAACAALLCLCSGAKLRSPCGIPQGGEMTCKWAYLWQCQRMALIVFYIMSARCGIALWYCIQLGGRQVPVCICYYISILFCTVLMTILLSNKKKPQLLLSSAFESSWSFSCTIL